MSKRPKRLVESVNKAATVCRAQGAADERAAIVKWLQRRAKLGSSLDERDWAELFARAIKYGMHRRK